MALVRLVIDGKRVVADSSKTILEVVREQGLGDIPTLCHDKRLEPYGSCFVCVVKVKGARTLVPSCATKVTEGMVVETSSKEVKEARKAALELLLSNHYADCIGPCRLACPASVDIQGYLALAALGRHHDAVRLIKEKNPLPSVCGRVCTRPCEVKGCRRNLLDEPVGIDWVKRYVTDLAYGDGKAYQPQRTTPNGKKVAVIGAGPAGLSCAYYLALRGYAVDIYEAMPEPGGMLRYGIPAYRLPKDVLDLEVKQILDLGVTLKTNQALGRDFTLFNLKQKGYDAVFLGVGAWASSKMRVPGEEAEGVLSGIEFLRNFGLGHPLSLHGTVLVVGGGNTAIDCARTALRCGASEVRIVYRRTRAEMPANAAEIHDAEEEGVKFDFLTAPTRVIAEGNRVVALECQRMVLGEPDRSGRRSPKPVPGSEFQIKCAFIISAIGQVTSLAGLDDLPPTEKLELTRNQTLAVDERTGQTSVEWLFAGGDVVTGAATAIEGIASGRKAAYAIDQYLTSGVARPEPQEFFSRKDVFRKVTREDLKTEVPSKRQQMPMLAASERVKGFAEVELGLAHEQALAEAMRCMECGCEALFDCDLRRYATEYGVDITRFLGEAKSYKIDRTHPLIELDQNKCIACGRCVRMCAEVVGVAAFGYVNRGFDTQVRPALGGSLLETDCVVCGLCVDTCPTGAIAERLPLSKPGPWLTERVPSVCPYCGVGCTIDYQVHGDLLVTVSSGRGEGFHCRKGRFGYEYVQAEDRLAKATVRSGNELKEVGVKEALSLAASRLRGYDPAEVAVFVGERLTNEEAYLAQKIARLGLHTHNIAPFASLMNPDRPEVVSTGTYNDLASSQATLVVNSVLNEEHFTADLMLKRALRQGGKLVYVHPETNTFARFAHVFLKCKPGTEGLVVLAIAREAGANLPDGLADLDADRVSSLADVPEEGIREAARLLPKVIVFNRDFEGQRADPRLFKLAADSLGARLLAMRARANGQGVVDMGCHPAYFPGYRPVLDPAVVAAMEREWRGPLVGCKGQDILSGLKARRFRAVILIGEDPLGSPAVPQELKEGLLAADFRMVFDLFETETTRAAHVVLPMSAPAETSGTYTNSERRVQTLKRAVPPVAGMETWELLLGLGSYLGLAYKLDYRGPADIFEEIRRVAPIYRTVHVDSPEALGCSDIGALDLAPGGPDLGTFAPALPSPDTLEMRFERRFEAMMAEARARLSQGYPRA